MIEPLGNTPIHIIFRLRLSSKWRIRAMGELHNSLNAFFPLLFVVDGEEGFQEIQFYDIFWQTF